MMTKAETWAAFREAADALETDSATITRGWESAIQHAKGADPETWLAWVRKSVCTALSRGKSSPEGLWLTILRDGPGRALRTPRRNAAAHWEAVDQASEAYRATIRTGRAQAGHPPLSYGARAVGEGRAASEVYEAWQAAGCPDAGAFPYPFETEGQQ